MRKKIFLSICLLCSMAAIVGCSMMPFKKSPNKADKPEPAKQVQASTIEWGDRTWEAYAEDRNGVKHYFDKSAITYPSKGTIHVWRKRVFPEGAPGTRQVRSSHKEIITYDEMNCKTEKYRSLETQGVKWDGSLTEIFKKPTPWTDVYEDSADERMMNNYCAKADSASKP